MRFPVVFHRSMSLTYLLIYSLPPFVGVFVQSVSCEEAVKESTSLRLRSPLVLDFEGLGRLGVSVVSRHSIDESKMSSGLV